MGGIFHLMRRGFRLDYPALRGLKPHLALDPARQWFLFAVIVYGASMLYSTFLWRRGFQRDNWINYEIGRASCRERV